MIILGDIGNTETKICLVNNNKIIKIKPGINQHNKKYLETKKIIGKHLLKL